jgi:MmyB-like transcription regulator ligand binding domain
VDRELLAHFLRADQKEAGAPDDRAALVMTRIVERLSDYPAMVFSRFGEVLLQTRPAAVLFGDYTQFGGPSRYLVQRWLSDPAARERYLVEVGADSQHLRRYRHAQLGGLELYRQLLVEPEQHQMLLVFTAVPGSPSDAKLRLLATPDD